MPELVTPEIDFDSRRPLGFLQRGALTVVGATAGESEAKSWRSFDLLSVTCGDLSA